VFGVLLAFGMLFPDRQVMLLIPPIPMKAWVMVALYAALELFLGLGNFDSGVAHFAHLGGALTGFLLILYWQGFRLR
jgi:membrane associated rhomboid family serine protease